MMGWNDRLGDSDRDISDGEVAALSVVIVTPDTYQTIRTTMSYLRRQTVCDSLEVVIVASSRKQLELNDVEMAPFCRYEIIEAGPIESIGRANALGIRHATAPIVALAEDHCFPDRDWAQRLIAAHRGLWSAVGPAVRNANPQTSVSWADFLIGYGPWSVPAEAGEVTFLPGHNSSYKRDDLLDYGDRLESMMCSETVLHWDLRSQGRRLYLESGAEVAHVNFSLWSSWLPVQYHNGRLFAGTRVGQMSLFRRVVYIVGSPLIPWVRLCRIQRTSRSRGMTLVFLRCLPALVIGLVLDGLGQSVGYAFGAGSAADQVARYEFHRSRHITEQDRRRLFDQADESAACERVAERR
jgi:GT2 family glycosyltransferase